MQTLLLAFSCLEEYLFYYSTYQEKQNYSKSIKDLLKEITSCTAC